MDIDPRITRLNRLFNRVISGSGASLTHFSAPVFLEALAVQQDAPACVNKLFSSKCGLDSLQQAFWRKLNPGFFNNQVTGALAFFQHPALEIINGGTYLNEIVAKIGDPPIFWNPYRDAFLNKQLDSEMSQTAFGWLLLQLCSLPVEQAAQYRTHEDTDKILSLLTSSDFLANRTIGQKLKRVLATTTSIDRTLGPVAGGRHDNDFEDFRNISILPTADALQCTEPAFLRPAYVLEDPQTADTRVSMHLDNQFRLNREDMIYEMKEEIQIITEEKQARPQREQIRGFKLIGLECGENRKRNKWALVVECLKDLQRLKNLKNDVKKRKAYLLDHRNYIKHQSLAGLFIGKEIVAFPTILRNEDRLAKNPPQMVLQFDHEDAVQKAVSYCKTSPEDLYLVPMDVALFSYEPILRRLQSMNTLPLATHFGGVDQPSSKGSTCVISVVA